MSSSKPQNPPSVPTSPVPAKISLVTFSFWVNDGVKLDTNEVIDAREFWDPASAQGAKILSSYALARECLIHLQSTGKDVMAYFSWSLMACA